MTHITRLWLLVMVATSAMGSAQAADIAAGKALAQANCARCHAIGPDGESPLPAPRRSGRCMKDMR